MKGKHKIIVQNNRLHYEFEIKRNITVIQGNSATGKTTLINMLRQWENLGTSSGVDVMIIPEYIEPLNRFLGFFRNYPFLHFLTYLSFASSKRFLQRPYIVRFIIFNRLFVPSTKPLL